VALERVTSAEEVRQVLAAARRESKTVALVPTMGALHDGHLALVRAACQRAEFVVVSIFVNPTQFDPSEDFESYPRDLGRDLELLRAEGIDLLFTPTVEGMYPPGTDTVIEPGAVATLWEGEDRPGHFTGVCTVVAKLFNLVLPDLSFFGEKDFQQLVLVRKMVRDLDFATQIVAVPTVREGGGLALSSRNSYLTSEEHTAARVLYRALEDAQLRAVDGEMDAAKLAEGVATEIEAEPLAELGYAAVVDPETLEPLALIDRPARAIVAARFGRARLIDNVAIMPPARRPERSASASAEAELPAQETSA
jgi:pantoate--beta-alanine ligase